MSAKLMLLPSSEPHKPRLIAIPSDIDAHEAFRFATGIIAAVEEENPNCSWEDIEEVLEEKGFESVAYILGPEIN